MQIDKIYNERKIYQGVFDNRTIIILQKLIKKKSFDKINDIISTGKEADVYEGLKNQTKVALKIYRIETSSFQTMGKYIFLDPRFKNIKKNKQNLIYEWTKKEYKNLQKAYKHKVNVPFVFDYFKNIIVMQYLGDKKPALTLNKDKNINIEEIITQTIKNMHNLVYKANLIHADLSEYNMIYHQDKLYFIDFGQAVVKEHPFAKEFYERDIKNIAKFFNRFGFNFTEDKLKEYVKKGLYE